MSETIMSKALGILCDRCEIMSADCAHCPCELYVEMEQLLSAQPEIIRCRDCKWHKKEIGWNCIEYMVCDKSVINKPIRNDDDFCSRAERRTDGTD